MALPARRRPRRRTPPPLLAPHARTRAYKRQPVQRPTHARRETAPLPDGPTPRTAHLLGRTPEGGRAPAIRGDLRVRLPRQGVGPLRPLLRAARDGRGTDVRGRRPPQSSSERRGGPLGPRPAQGTLRAGRTRGDAGVALRRGRRVL